MTSNKKEIEMSEEKKETKNPPEAHGPGAPLSDQSAKGFYTETESYLDFLSHFDS